MPSTYIALLRGINVGGHHKVPMADLQEMLEDMGFTDIKTLLNSGNVIFDSKPEAEEKLEEKISKQLEKTFGFPVPVLLRNADDIKDIISYQPFKNIEVTKDTRLYLTFFKEEPKELPDLPWQGSNPDFRILEVKNNVLFSVLDVSKTKTVDSMSVLGKFLGSNITTRNWNTIVKIGNKL